MTRYVYEFHVEPRGEEVFFLFPRLPEIHSAVSAQEFAEMDRKEIFALAEDAVVTALQARISARENIPVGDERGTRGVEGTVAVSTLQSMKLEFYRLCLPSAKSIPDIARKMGKPETSVRRLLDLRHRSLPAEIDTAFSLFGKRLVTDLSVEAELGRVVHRLPAGGVRHLQGAGSLR